MNPLAPSTPVNVAIVGISTSATMLTASDHDRANRMISAPASTTGTEQASAHPTISQIIGGIAPALRVSASPLHRYPRPHTVCTRCWSPSFDRSRLTCTVTVDRSPKSQRHTCLSSSSRENTVSAWVRKNSSSSNSRLVRLTGCARRPYAERDAVEHGQFVDRQLHRRHPDRRRCPAQHRPHPQGQLAWAERLGQVVVGACLQPGDPVVLLAERGQQDHRNRVVAALTQAAAQRQAVGPGHHHVQHRDVDALGAEQPQRLVSVAGDRDVEAVAFQIAAHDIADDGVVVGDQHSCVTTPRVAAAKRPTCGDVTVLSLLPAGTAQSSTGLASEVMADGSVTVVLPCLNEAASLPGVLAAIPHRV